MSHIVAGTAAVVSREKRVVTHPCRRNEDVVKSGAAIDSGWYAFALQVSSSAHYLHLPSHPNICPLDPLTHPSTVLALVGQATAYNAYVGCIDFDSIPVNRYTNVAPASVGESNGAGCAVSPATVCTAIFCLFADCVYQPGCYRRFRVRLLRLGRQQRSLQMHHIRRSFGHPTRLLRVHRLRHIHRW
jgi:hypothetical protein